MKSVVTTWSTPLKLGWAIPSLSAIALESLRAIGNCSRMSTTLLCQSSWQNTWCSKSERRWWTRPTVALGRRWTRPAEGEVTHCYEREIVAATARASTFFKSISYDSFCQLNTFFLKRSSSHTKIIPVISQVVLVWYFISKYDSLFQIYINFFSKNTDYSTVTLFARLRGWSTSVPRSTATW